MAAKTIAREQFLGRLIRVLNKDVSEFGLAELPTINPPITTKQINKALNDARLLRVVVGNTEIVVPRSAEFGNCQLETTWGQDLVNVRRIKLARS